jgi:hypothetical protein
MLLVKKRLEQHKPRHSEWNSEFTALLWEIVVPVIVLFLNQGQVTRF